MEAYYSNQASNSMPHFSGHYRQRGSGFGALAAGIGRVALPLARRVIWPAAKKIGRELLVQGAPELLEFATKKKSAKQALKSTVKKQQKNKLEGHFNLVRKQSIAKGQPRRKHIKGLYQRKGSFLKKQTHKGVDRLSSLKWKMRTNFVIPTEATHSSLDLFEKPPLLVTFDQSFKQKTGPLYSPTGSSLEFEIVGDRNNFIDLQKIYLEIKFRVVRSNGNDLRFTTGDANNSDTPHLVNNTLHSLFTDCSVSANGIKNFFRQWSLRTQEFHWNRIFSWIGCEQKLAEMSRIRIWSRPNRCPSRYVHSSTINCEKISPNHNVWKNCYRFLFMREASSERSNFANFFPTITGWFYDCKWRRG